jgi:hypothetical protein
MTNENCAREEELKKLERELISDLREEAAEAKKCFTTFSFQTIAFSAAIIGLIFKSIQDDPITALAAIPGISFLMIVCRIGIYKYQTANRAYGYQFYLEQSKTYLYKINSKKSNSHEYSEDESETQKAWELIIENRSWEQVFRVWRIIHPTIFKRIYVTPKKHNIILLGWLLDIWYSISPSMYRYTKYTKKQIKKLTSTENEDAQQGDQNNQKLYLWCFLKYISTRKMDIPTNLENTKKTIKMNSEYKSGTYLKNMLMILFILQGIFLFCLLLANFVVFDEIFIERKLSINIFLPISFIIMLIITIFRIIRTDRRRDIIENELCSIHACEITWQIIALVHYRATKQSQISYNSQSPKNKNWYSVDKIYLKNIGSESEKIINNLFCLDNWINETIACPRTQIAPKTNPID